MQARAWTMVMQVPFAAASLLSCAQLRTTDRSDTAAFSWDCSTVTLPTSCAEQANVPLVEEQQSNGGKIHASMTHIH